MTLWQGIGNLFEEVHILQKTSACRLHAHLVLSLLS